MENKINMRESFSPRVSKVAPSKTLAITARAKALSREGKNVVNFAGGEPDFDTPDYIKKSAIEAINEGYTKYTPSIGSPELKQAICNKFEEENNLHYSPHQIVVGCGAKHCLYNIFQVICSKGDEVIMPSPYWVSYPEMVKLAGAMPKIIKTERNNGFKITPQELEDAIGENTKAFILNSPANPTGTVYEKSELMELIEVLKSKDIYIISDEIYSSLVFGTEVTSIAVLDKGIREKTIVVSGVSKTYAMTGWRIGYFAAPEEIVAEVSKIQSHSTSNPCSISQKAALSALTQEDDSIENMISNFDKRRKVIYSELKKTEKLHPFLPQGGFYTFCGISDVSSDSLEFSKSLLEKKNVAVIPGIAFGYEGYVRMSFATSMERIKEGISRIRNWIKG